MATKPVNNTSQGSPHDLDNFMKSKSISDVSLKTLIVVTGTMLAVAGAGYAMRPMIDGAIGKRTIEIPQPTYTTPLYETPVYTAPLPQQRPLILFAPILFTHKVGASGCIDKFIAAAKSAGATVQTTSQYSEGVFMTAAQLDTSDVTAQCHTTSAGSASLSLLVTAGSVKEANISAQTILNKMTEWHYI